VPGPGAALLRIVGFKAFSTSAGGLPEPWDESMSVDHIRYDLLTQDALRGVIRTVLTDAAVKGLPGDHHFFITFDTRADGVRMSTRLRASYPEDMTIVLQHQFWDLTVGEDDFDVGLAFNGIPERLHIPLKAVKAFFDPSVQFGLQFTVEPDGTPKTETEAKSDAKSETKTEEKADVPPRADAKSASAGKKGKPAPGEEPVRKTKSTPPAADSAKLPAQSPDNAGKDTPTGEVVRLDRFRKK
jgi:hypothetical protein